MIKNNAIRKIIIVTLFMIFTTTSIFATSGINRNFPIKTNQINTITNSADKVWGTVTTIVQILAFAAIVFAGLRYMFSSADQKADIKRSLGILAIGAILVFAASTVVKFIVNATNEIISN